MATGGEGQDPGDRDFHPFRPRAPTYRRQLSQHDIGNQARYLLTNFINDRMNASGIPDTPGADDMYEPGTPSGPPVEHITAVASALKKISDELDGDDSLQRLINQLPADAPKETFMKVAHEIFSDGTFNWGRVTMLFYLAFKMAVKFSVEFDQSGRYMKMIEVYDDDSELDTTPYQLPLQAVVVGSGLNELCSFAFKAKAVSSCFSSPLPIIRHIVEWVVSFIVDYVAGWIISRGGWEAIQEYFGASSHQVGAVFLTGIITSVLVWWWNR